MNSPNISLQKKTAARIAAVQCVYTRLMSDIMPTSERQIAAVKKRLENNAAEQKLVIGMALEPNYTLLASILKGTEKHEAKIDERLNSALSESWKRERMSPILIAILQCAIFELFFHKDAAFKIIINEYSDVASRFFDGAEVSFVHGALASLYTKYHG